MLSETTKHLQKSRDRCNELRARIEELKKETNSASKKPEVSVEELAKKKAVSYTHLTLPTILRV